ALMARPRLILFDEPSLGLAPTLVEATFEIIADIRRRGTTVLMVEQNAYLALRMADRGYVMETGRVVLGGPAAELLGNDLVRRAGGVVVNEEDLVEIGGAQGDKSGRGVGRRPDDLGVEGGPEAERVPLLLIRDLAATV